MAQELERFRSAIAAPAANNSVPVAAAYLEYSMSITTLYGKDAGGYEGGYPIDR